MDFQQIHAHYEKAARIYCKKAELDPDMLMPAPGEQKIVGAPPVLWAQWRFVAEDLYNLSLKLISLREGSEPEKGKH